MIKSQNKESLDLDKVLLDHFSDIMTNMISDFSRFGYFQVNFKTYELIDKVRKFKDEMLPATREKYDKLMNLREKFKEKYNTEELDSIKYKDVIDLYKKDMSKDREEGIGGISRDREIYKY